ncbi:gliding motility-associated C-terminal domain-containing protein [Mangrovimonas sp. AS39]|uniref:T9SS type B sorting domain-containing protein n=1 Tax=Mangrovimonas futianensis TaxID=2895523 RepID=UPI001E48BB7B|nr:gliding motility-associated C-terminal domain-containing protein [Mangrovimonas futianensis]MCF1192914.1 gliding motility-associated C-terminal domain-containing protein [Mangrovimonas futianensis]MCF1196484.1 gliding motility-associated C-terminal domain-containing protein [Mangrovimonas futianensis]
MKKRLLFILLIITNLSLVAQEYEILNVTSGYNADVIANGNGSAFNLTSVGVDDANYAFMSTDFVNPSGVSAPATALPSDGLISSGSISGLTYQMGDYSSNNSLRLSALDQTETMVFSNQVSATDLYVLVTSGSGASTIFLQVNFADGTNTSSIHTAPDWYNSNTLPIALQGVGRVNRNNNNIETPFNNPRIYRIDVEIAPEDQTKLIESVQFSKISTTGVFNAFAISANLLSTCPSPESVTFSSISLEGAVASWDVPVVEPTSYDYYFSDSNTAPTDTTEPTGNTTDTSVDLDGFTPVTTYYFWIRSNCGEGDEGPWIGPFSFLSPIGNDECFGALDIPVNPDEDCVSVVSADFSGATESAQASDCATANSGDIWYQFTAVENTHIIDLVNFDYQSDQYVSTVILTLYEGTECDALNQMYCSTNNSITAYGLTPGTNYFLKVLYIFTAGDIDLGFDICVKTPEPNEDGSSVDCLINTVNSDFSYPVVNGIFPPLIDQDAVLGWSTTAADGFIEIWPVPNFQNVPSYSGDQFIELNANLEGGVYQDFDTPVTTTFNYGFAHRGRSGVDTCELLAGPPGGPYVSVEQVSTGNSTWSYNTGSYVVPNGQPVTRFIFQAVSTATGDNSVGNFLDAISFTANNGILTDNPLNMACDQDEITVSAAGIGSWTILEGNPSETVIADPSSNETVISGFSAPGTYYFEWETLYCSDILEVVFTAPVLEFSFEFDTICFDQDFVSPILSDGFETGGAFSSAEGLSIDPITGVIDVQNSIPGSYDITYTIDPSQAGDCDNTYSTSISIVNPVAEFSYDQDPICGDVGLVAPIFAEGFSEGGIFSADIAGLDLNAATGEINSDNSAIGDYVVTYTLDESVLGCGVSYSVSVSIVAPVVEFSYEFAGICFDETTVSPILGDGFTTGGTFTGQTGLTLDASTGIIDVANSSPGMYMVTYNLPADVLGCEDSYEVEFSIYEGVALEISGACDGLSYYLSVESLNDLDVNDMTITWTGPNSFSDSGDIIEIVDSGVYEVTAVSVNGCEYTGSFTVESTFCTIPEVITPNSDGFNDSFDLTGLNVSDIKIFNRYGTEVFSEANYTNQWHGQEKGSSKTLPVGTYFYVLKFADQRESLTGWVYMTY